MMILPTFHVGCVSLLPKFATLDMKGRGSLNSLSFDIHTCDWSSNNLKSGLTGIIKDVKFDLITLG